MVRDVHLCQWGTGKRTERGGRDREEREEGPSVTKETQAMFGQEDKSVLYKKDSLE